MGRYLVGRASELPPGQRRIVEVEGRSIGIFNVHGRFYALRNRCPHQAAPLCLGSIKGMTLPGKPGEYVWAREGDTLVVTRLDRLARSTLHLCQIAEELRRKGIHLQVLDQQIHTNDATGRLLFHMLGAIAQFETELRAERQMDGIQLAKARGVVFGRSKQLTPAQVAELQERREQGVLIRTLMQDYRISKATVYRYLHTQNVPTEGAPSA